MTAFLVNVDVPDVEAAVTFYCAAFELRVGRRMGVRLGSPQGVRLGSPQEDFVELLGAETPIYLLLKDAKTKPFSGAVMDRDYARHWTPVHLDFVVDDLDAALARAIAAGAKQEGEVSRHAYGRLALLSDPFGHGVCLLQFNAQGYDALMPGNAESRN